MRSPFSQVSNLIPTNSLLYHKKRKQKRFSQSENIYDCSRVTHNSRDSVSSPGNIIDSRCFMSLFLRVFKTSQIVSGLLNIHVTNSPLQIRDR